MQEALVGARSPGGREPLISVRLDELYEEYSRRRRRSCPLCCLPRLPVGRCCHATCFCLQLTAAAVASAAPWALALAEALTVLLVYFLAERGGWWEEHHYSFSSSAADLVVLSLVRCLAISAVYACWPALLYRRPYLLAAAGYACVTVPVATVKIAAAKHISTPARRLPAFLALCALQIVFSVLHVAAAQGVIVYARRRWLLGLTSPGARLRDEEGWTLWSPASAESSSRNGGGGSIDEEKGALPEHLADADSLFVDDCAGPTPLSVHYKVAVPGGGSARELGTAGVMLIHQYGGGVHSWRMVMQPLADAAGAPVVAFDRPGFGLTSRPLPPEGPPGSNPYSLGAHAALAVRLAARLGLERVVFAGTEDGALVALKAAALLLRPGVRGGVPARRAPATVAAADLPPPSPSSMGGSLDLGWMGSAVSPASRRPLLQQLLQGEWKGKGVEGGARRGDGDSALDAAAGGSGPAGDGCNERAVSARTGSDAPPAESLFDLDVEGGAAAAATAAPLFPPLTIHAHARTLSSIPSVEPEAEFGGEGERGIEGGRGPDLGSPVTLVGLALLHPDLSGRCGSRFVRLLGRSRLGRRVLRDLLGAELGAVSNRAAWGDETLLTPDILALYRRPMQCVGWDEALLRVSTASSRLPTRELSAMLEALGAGHSGAPPALVFTGEQDKLATPAAAGQLAGQLGARLEVGPGGHLSHEEYPEALALVLATFVRHCAKVSDAQFLKKNGGHY